MEGWSEYEIKNDMQTRFKALTKPSYGVTIKDYSTMIKTCKLKISDKELQFLIDSAPKKADGKIDWKLFSSNF